MVRLWLTLAVSQVQGGVMCFPRCTPRCFNEFTKALGTANALVYGDRKKTHTHKKQVAAKFTSSNHFSPGNKIVLSAGALVQFWPVFCGFESKSCPLVWIL